MSASPDPETEFGPVDGPPHPPLAEAPTVYGPHPEVHEAATLREARPDHEAPHEADTMFGPGGEDPTLLHESSNRFATISAVPGFDIFGELGRGGMGVVYKARQLRLNRIVALKMILAGGHSGAEGVERFRAEAESVARLQHPNIVQVFEVGEHAGLPFIALEFVEGGALDRTLDGTPWAPLRAARLVETLARAVHEAHRRGVVHRDLKPANILLTADGTPKVTDFGLAKRLDVEGGQTQSGAIMGTPSYMAPEQAGHKAGVIGPATDVYALGAIFYELLTGRPPFKASTPLDTVIQVVGEEPVPPSRLQPGLDRDAETICLTCLEKDPARRYSTAEALAADLDLYLAGRPILRRRIGQAERSWRWCRRNPPLAASFALAATAVVALAVGSTVAAWTFRNQRDEIARDQGQIRAARGEAREQLFGALAAQAHAGRSSRQLGQRFDSLKALHRAAAIGIDMKFPRDRLDPLRDEAIACLAIPDLEAGGPAIRRPPGAVAFAFDAGMTRYAFRFRDGSILVRRVTDDREIARFRARGDRDIWIFALSPDGRYLATSQQQPGLGLTLWDVDERKVVVDEPGPVAISSNIFSADSKLFALAPSDGGVTIYDLKSGRPRWQWRAPGRVSSLAIRRDGARIAFIASPPSSPTCWIVETETGQLVRSIPLPDIGNVAWSPDGTTLSIGGEDTKISLWDASTGIRRATMETASSGFLNTAFHPAGTVMASWSFGDRARFWDPVLGRLRLEMPAGLIPSFSDDGHISMWVNDEVKRYRVEPALGYRTLVHVADPSPNYGRPSIRRDGRLLAVGTDQGVALWDLEGGEVGFLPIGNAWNLLFEPSGDLLTSGSAGVLRWPIRSEPAGGGWRLGPPLRLPLPTSFAGINEDRAGRTVALANFTTAHVLAPDRAFEVGPLDDCRGISVSPDGRWLATGGHSIGAQVWRCRDGEKVADLPIDGGGGVTFSPDGKWLMTSEHTSRLWAVETWRESRRFAGMGLGFSPDGRMALIKEPSKVLWLVEAETGRPIARLESPDRSDVGSAAFSPDGSRLVVTSNDLRAAQVWDLRAIRRRLAAMGLDWDAPAFADVDPAGLPAKPLPPILVSMGELDGYAGPTSLARKEFNKADDFLFAGRIAEAIAEYEVMLKLEPDTVRLHLGLIIALRAAGRTTEATPHRNSIHRSPQAAADFYLLGLILQERGRLDAAIIAYDEASRLDGDHMGAALPSLADALLLAGRNAEAVGAFEAILRLGPRELFAHRALVVAMRAGGRDDAAVAGHREAARLDPNSATGYWNLGNALRGGERLDAAIIAYEEAVRLDGDREGAALLALGEVLFRAGRYDEAVATHKALVRYGPDDPARRYNLALTLLKAGDRPGYRLACAEAVRRLGHPQVSAIGLLARSCLLAPDALDNPATALRLAKVAVAQDHKAPSLRAVLGLAYYRAGRHALAIKSSEESIRLAPHAPAVALNWPVLAMAHHQLGQDAEARRWLELAHGWEGDAHVESKASWQDRADFSILLREADEQIADQAFPTDPFQR